MRRMRSTKIIATLGPTSSNGTMVRGLFEAGADMFRLNFSHTDSSTVKSLVKLIRELERNSGRPIGIVGDLQGPKIRLGEFSGDEVFLNEGASFQLDQDNTLGDQKRVCLPHKEVFAAVSEGDEILLNDGRIRLKVQKVLSEQIKTQVMVAGEVSNHKGVNVPGVTLPLKALTSKDQADLAVALKLGIDWIALSFVQRAQDVAEVKDLINGRSNLMTKIEKPSAVAERDEIYSLSDGLMVARGDLGVEMAVEQVPGVQKQLIRSARAAGKPIVVATQMLESMINSSTPTRAEVSDVATAVYDGADAVMLSAESAIGNYPVEAVRTMNRIAEEVENDSRYRAIVNAEKPIPESTSADAISASAAQTAETLAASAIVSYTATGSTAARAARERPSVPILSLTPKIETARGLSLFWGVHCMQVRDPISFNDMVELAFEAALADGIAEINDRLVIIAGVPFGTAGATNVMRVARVRPSSD